MEKEINYKEKIIQTAKKAIENRKRKLIQQREDLQIKVDVFNKQIEVEDKKLKQLV